MKYGKIVLQQSEFEFIQNLIKKRLGSGSSLSDEWCVKLNSELSDAIVKEEEEMPEDVVRFNSVVDVETPFGIKKGIVLVKPNERNIEQNKISILSPMGSALIGYAKKDEVEWNLPKGKSTIKILNVLNKKAVSGNV